MNIPKLTPFAIALAILAGSPDQMLKVTNVIRRAQLQLIQDSKASKWPKAPLLKPFKRPM